MAGEFRMEVSIPPTRYVLNLAAAKGVLSVLETFGDDCSSVCKTMRDDMRAAIALYETTGRMPADEEPEISEEHEYRITLADAAPAKDTPAKDAPRCHACGAPGREIPAKLGDTESLWVCDAPECWRHGRPAARKFFETGIR